MGTTRRQIDDDLAIGLDGNHEVPDDILAGAPPGYPDPPAYTPHPLDDPAFLPDPPESATGRLHPRAAVILGLKTHWHKWLFFCRLLSVAPELRFGIPILWKLSWFLLGDQSVWQAFHERGDPVFIFIEAAMAALWCAVSAYASSPLVFFTIWGQTVCWNFRIQPRTCGAFCQL